MHDGSGIGGLEHELGPLPETHPILKELSPIAQRHVLEPGHRAGQRPAVQASRGLTGERPWIIMPERGREQLLRLVPHWLLPL